MTAEQIAVLGSNDWETVHDGLSGCSGLGVLVLQSSEHVGSMDPKGDPSLGKGEVGGGECTRQFEGHTEVLTVNAKDSLPPVVSGSVGLPHHQDGWMCKKSGMCKCCCQVRCCSIVRRNHVGIHVRIRCRRHQSMMVDGSCVVDVLQLDQEQTLILVLEFARPEGSRAEAMLNFLDGMQDNYKKRWAPNCLRKVQRDFES